MGEEYVKQLEAMNSLLVEIIQNQKGSNKTIFKIYLVTIVCFTLIIIAILAGLYLI